jgi:hypothetical protein
MIVLTTLTCIGMPRWAEPQTEHWERTVWPELRLVMMKSSNDNANDSRAAATMPGRTRGTVTRQNVCLVGVAVSGGLLQPRDPARPAEPSR